MPIGRQMYVRFDLTGGRKESRRLMEPATHEDDPSEDEDLWDRITDVLEPIAEAVDPDPPPHGAERTAPEKQRK
jgi:hypothetical protein